MMPQFTLIHGRAANAIIGEPAYGSCRQVKDKENPMYRRRQISTSSGKTGKRC
ncbi:hypothetical protein KCP69_04690 [Salmonella enterica subsp. enterica]|nr:hypothetical protein KCP69_04690 [Salmonella enterica subsp. enterica]